MRVSIIIALISAAIVSAAPTLQTGIKIVPNSHIVLLKENADVKAFDEWARGIISRSNQRPEGIVGTVNNVWDLEKFKGLSGKFDAEFVALASQRPEVDAIVPNQIHHLFAKQENPPSWGLSRISNPELSLGGQYLYPDSAGAGVTAYIIDTGIRTTHTEFEGRASMGFSAFPNVNHDDSGHGTHVSGTVGGKTHGVAKLANLVGVKVCSGSGECSTENIVNGINFVVVDSRGKKAVANMSLGGAGDEAIDRAVNAAIAGGVAFALAAGNAHNDACTTSPARVPLAVTVGSSTDRDAESSYSNYGQCVDLYAPGSGITSAWNTGDSATNTISGTSMASPHACGVLALHAATGDFTPKELHAILVDSALKDKLSGIGAGSPNLLLYNGGEGLGGAKVAKTIVDLQA